MAFTESNMLPLGTIAPDFQLIDTVSDLHFDFEMIRGKNGTVVLFLCNHCPYVIHLNEGIVKIAKEYLEKGIGFVGISSNDVINYPADSPENMKILAAEVGYPFPYLYDESQEIAIAYDAACTPDFYVFDAEKKLVYRGQFDGSRPKNDTPVTGADLKQSLNSLLEGLPQVELQRPSGGCNIKWKK